MKKMKNYLKTGILLTGISLLLWSCEKSNEFESINEIKGVKLKEYKFEKLNSNITFNELFDSYKYSIKDKRINSQKSLIKDPYEFTIDSSKIKEIIFEDYTSYTFLIKRNIQSSDYFENLIIEKNKLGEINAYIIKYSPNNAIEYYNNHKTFNFEGKRTIQKINYNNSQVAARDGEYCEYVRELWCSYTFDHVAGESCDEHTFYKYVKVCSETDTLEDNGNNSLPSGNLVGQTTGNIPLGDSNPEGVETIITAPVGPDNSITEAPEQIIIDQTFIDETCLKSVYDEMGKSTKFQEYLQNFNETFSVADLKFTTDNSFSGNEDSEYHNAMAITKPPLLSNEIEIKFNTDINTSGNILDKPDVFKAVSMIHEMIHAEMYRKMLDAMIAAEGAGSTLDWTDFTRKEFDNYLDTLQNKYFGIWDYYVRYDDNSNTPDNGQHQQMAQHYRNIIKQALTDYDPTLTDIQKEALSWIGLNEANIIAWQNLDEDPNLSVEDEQKAINDLITQIKNTFPNGCN